MEAIAAEAGVTKPILYRQFRNKAALYEALAVRYTEAIATDLRKTMRRKDHPQVILRAAVDAYIRLVERETEIYRFLMQRARLSRLSGDGPVENFMRRLGDEIGLVYGEQLREAGLDSGPAEVWGHGVVGMVSAAVDWWVDRRVVPRPRLVEYLTDLLWDGLSRAGAAPATPITRVDDNVVPMRGKS
jgi:AcrR family transcriptional regulator